MITKEEIELIKKRLYCLEEEYSKLIEDVQRFRTEEQDESFWGFDLGDNLFVLCNAPIQFWGGPRNVTGMVGYHVRGIMQTDETIELFKKAGQEAIDYANKKV